MHGIPSTSLTVENADPPPRQSPTSRLLNRFWKSRFFILFVLFPTLVVAIYYALFAAPQYESEAHLIVRSNSGTTQSAGGLSQMLGLGGAKGGNSTAELADFLRSHDAVGVLQKRIDLLSRFSRPEADFFSRLSKENPDDEDLVKFFRRMVNVAIDTETGIAIVKVRGFRPIDARTILEGMLRIGEQRVNALNVRANDATLGSARRQVAEAEQNGRLVERELGQFRNVRSDIDPQGTGDAQTKMVSALSQQLALAQAQLDSVSTVLGSGSPQYRALSVRVASLKAQVAGQSDRLVGGNNSIAAGLAGYSELKLRQDFAAKRYEAAAGALEKARETAMDQQLFVTRLVEPNMPEKATYPKGVRNTVTVFMLLIILFGIGSLLLAGVREHSA